MIPRQAALVLIAALAAGEPSAARDAGAPSAAGAAACDEGAIDLRGDWGRARFRVEVADTADARARGLMFVEDLPRGEGMLFAYGSPQPVAFWMRNTLISLDMIFLSPEGVVTRVHERAVPGDETPIPGGDEVQFVLEINGGLARALGIEEGSEARHPLIGEDAAWPCDDG